MTRFGARPTDRGTCFRLLAGYGGSCELVLLTGSARGEYRMPQPQDGVAELLVPRAAAGDRYSYRLNGGGPRPDPASRFQPEGVHGPSEVVDPAAYQWSDDDWLGPLVRDLVVYELHVGTFTSSGTFLEARDRLDDLRDLGITAIELMPIADFPGRRNWGYDGVALYAPSRAYGRPDDLRALVNRAHTLGLAVLLDVVYNHLGPEGAYLPEFNPPHLTDRHETPWGQAVNLDGPRGDLVRRFLIDSALHWIREYHIDGLRLDATHALIDGRARHFVRELSDAVHEEAARVTVERRSCRPGEHRRVILLAEDERNLSDIVARAGDSAWRMDGVWADDFHHVVRRLVCGDSHGYYADYVGTTAELARTIRQGWLYCGERSRHRQRARGTDPSGVPMCRFLICVQNHDQIGNRAFGERLHHQTDAATWRAVSTVLLTAPMTPLLFMGQEWAASTPFLFFTDLEPALGSLVTEGRRREFRAFPQFQHVEARDRIPDPQADSTFEASRLRWSERQLPRHAGVLALYRALLELRRTIPALGGSSSLSGEAVAPDAQTLIVRRACGPSVCWIVTCLRGSSRVSLDDVAFVPGEASAWEVVLTTEDPRYAEDPNPVRVDMPAGPVVAFERPGAVILRATTTGHSTGARPPRYS
jgi:maltooligosyltrehalose trehalohydrolase